MCDGKVGYIWDLGSWAMMWMGHFNVGHFKAYMLKKTREARDKEEMLN